MKQFQLSRRSFLKTAGAVAGSSLLHNAPCVFGQGVLQDTVSVKADYSLKIATTPLELAPNRIISVTTYNGQFPGPLLRLKEGRRVTVDIHNGPMSPSSCIGTDSLWGQMSMALRRKAHPLSSRMAVDVSRLFQGPSGLRFYHTHVRAGADLAAGQYSGLVGPVYIEPKDDPGRYDREVFLTMKEFQPTLSRGGDMAMDFLAPSQTVPALKTSGESSMNASLAKGNSHGYEVGYDLFTINGKMLGHGEPVRVKQGERVLFHVLNGSAGEIRSLALPGHTFTIIAMDGNPLPKPVRVPGLWLGTAERISAIVDMNHPGVWVMGDLSDDDRKHGMGIVVEYTGYKGKAQWIAPKPFKWNYAHFGRPSAPSAQPDEVFDMLFEKQNAAMEGFNQWTINGTSYPMEQTMAKPMFHLQEGKRYRIRMKNASDDIHPIHLHRHSFELTHVAGQPASGVMKDVVMVGGYQEMEIDFTANNPGPTLFHCHQQLHMDFGFMALFDYV